MPENPEDQAVPVLVAMSLRQFLQVVFIGAIVGGITWGLTVLLDAYVVKAVVCHGPAAARCGMSLQYATASASIITAGLAVAGLARLQVFRSLLVGIAVTFTLWNEVMVLITSSSWQMALLLSLGMYALAYALMAWLVRLRPFVVAVVIVIVAVVAFRLMLY